MYEITITRSIEDTDEDPRLFCPITKEACDVHCMWLVKTNYLSDKGVDSCHQCAVIGIFGVLLNLDGARDEEY